MGFCKYEMALLSGKLEQTFQDRREGHTICQDKFVFSHQVECMFVNKELTSKEHITSLLCLYILAQSAKLKESLIVD